MVIVGRQQRGVDTAIAAINAEHPDAQLRGVVADLALKKASARCSPPSRMLMWWLTTLGIFNDKDFFSVPDSEWMHFYNVNVLSGVRLSRHYAQG